MFYSDVLSNFTSNLSIIQNNIETIIKRNKPYIQNDDNVATVSIYRISMPIDYNKIITRFNKMYKKYSNHEQLRSWKPIPNIEIEKVEKREHVEMLSLLDDLVGDMKPSEETSISSIPPTPQKIKPKAKKIVVKKKGAKK